MRRRALLLLFFAGGLVAASAAGFSSGVLPWHNTSTPLSAFARTDLVDAPAPVSLDAARDALARHHDTRRDLAVAFGMVLALALGGGWWIARDRHAHPAVLRAQSTRRTRAPPRLVTIVHC
jgi:hypothetical protein